MNASRLFLLHPKPMKRFLHITGKLGPAAALTCLMLLAGCSSTPPHPSAAHQTALPATVGGPSPLAREVARQAAGHPGRSAVRPLADPIGAFAFRAALIRAATRTVDAQYYIWKPDTCGRLLLEELEAAANRGVSVRLLVDDFGTSKMDAELAHLDAHPMAEVRIFNAFTFRKARALDFLFDFRRVNRRMHNKSLTVDGAVTVVGGRNISDQYFGGTQKTPFSDLDVAVAGPAVREVEKSFSGYWTSEQVSAARDHLKQCRTTSSPGEMTSPAGERYLKATAALRFPHDLAPGGAAWEWLPVVLLADDPAKADPMHGASRRDLHLVPKLEQVLGTPETEMFFVNPYFVPTTTGTLQLAGHAKAGLDVRVLTNSLATNSLVVHAGYSNWRRQLLEAGVRLYEVSGDRAAPANLHAKTFAVDGRRLFVGSFNMDPRSARTNTEMGLMLDSPRLAGATARAFEEQIPLMTHEVRLGTDRRLEWHEQTPDGTVVHRREPHTSFWRRMTARCISWLPIEPLL